MILSFESYILAGCHSSVKKSKDLLEEADLFRALTNGNAFDIGIFFIDGELWGHDFV